MISGDIILFSYGTIRDRRGIAKISVMSPEFSPIVKDYV